MSVTSGRTRGGGSRGRAELDGVRRRAPGRAVATGAHRRSSVTVTASLLPGLGSQPLTECVCSLGSRAGAEGGEGAPGGLGGPLEPGRSAAPAVRYLPRRPELSFPQVHWWECLPLSNDNRNPFVSSSVPKRTRQMKRKNRRPKKKKVKEGVFPKVGKEKEYDQARRRETAKEKGKRR